MADFVRVTELLVDDRQTNIQVYPQIKFFWQRLPTFQKFLHLLDIHVSVLSPQTPINPIPSFRLHTKWPERASNESNVCRPFTPTRRDSKVETLLIDTSHNEFSCDDSHILMENPRIFSQQLLPTR